MPDASAIARLRAEQQYFFLPFYREVVAGNPLGIAATECKTLVQQTVVTRFGFDPFDASISGFNPSTGLSAASQWANNLISNRVLDEFMTVVREGRATLYPWSVSASLHGAQGASGTPRLDAALRRAASDRIPRAAETQSRQYLRCQALAELVRLDAQYRCILDSADCRPFPSKAGSQYVEVHHVVPMSAQSETPYNLDRYENMVALCVRCHAIVHRAYFAIALGQLEAILDRYHALRGLQFADAMSSARIATEADALVARY